MSVTDYERQILSAYCGEIRGAITFEAMAEAETDPTARAIWTGVARIEAVTRDSLAPLAHRLHGNLEEAAAEARREGLARAAARRGLGWQQIASDYLPQLDGFLARFEALEASAPPADRATLAQLSEHSRAFGDCIRLWLDGDADAARQRLSRYVSTYAPATTETG